MRTSLSLILLSIAIILVAVHVGRMNVRITALEQQHMREALTFAKVLEYKPCIGTLDLTPYNLLPAPWRAFMFMPINNNNTDTIFTSPMITSPMIFLHQ